MNKRMNIQRRGNKRAQWKVIRMICTLYIQKCYINVKNVHYVRYVHSTCDFVYITRIASYLIRKIGVCFFFLHFIE